MKKEFDARHLDIRRFAEEGAQLSGQAPLSAFERLIGETEGRGGERPVHWQARGELRDPRHLQPQMWVHLEAGASLALVCQRCLQPVDVDVAVQRSFRFVPDEATAAREDDEAEEDVLVESRAFDLVALVEDELLMDMPVVPRHEVCPERLPTSAGEAEFEAAEAKRENPFAVLGRLKGGSGSGS
jgi:uncharacterized protein